MQTVDLSREAFRAASAAIAASDANDLPIVMLNLLRFRKEADYSGHPGEPACSGREAYHGRYASAVKDLMRRNGARLVWLGPVLAPLIAPPEELWDEMMLVEYPTFGAFRNMIADPEYQAAVHHRMAALEDSRLIATTKQVGAREA